MSEGSFGVVYSGVDKDTGEEIVMKICKEEDMNRIESNVMKLLNRKAIKNFPKLLYSGIMPKGPGLILQRFGFTLDYYLTEREDLFSYRTTIQIGI